jgi:hypothetical protein
MSAMGRSLTVALLTWERLLLGVKQPVKACILSLGDGQESANGLNRSRGR